MDIKNLRPKVAVILIGILPTTRESQRMAEAIIFPSLRKGTSDECRKWSLC
jgi:hypothetical protein